LLTKKSPVIAGAEALSEVEGEAKTRNPMMPVKQ
jgi:hypothetical protein